ncbi:unnamed protein product [Diamesa serratosioi]
MSTSKVDQSPELEWIQMKKDFDSMQGESGKDKMFRKIKENPMVPIGCLATAGALTFGLYSFKQGERQMSQYMMRARILAQGFTVVALIVGVGLSLSTKVPVKKLE